MIGLFFSSLQFALLRWLLPVLILTFGVLCALEIGQLIRLKNLRFPYPLCFIFILLLLGDGYLAGLRHGALLLVGAVIFLLSDRVLRGDLQNVAAEVGSGLLATGYIGLPMGMAAAMSQMNDATGAPIGKYLIFYQAAVIACGDSAAYLVGTRWGRTPFFTKISPKKTVEGAVACVVVSVIVAILMTLLAPALRGYFGFRHGLALGVILGLVAPLGDLAESAFKRDAGRKDSTIYDFTGHGGFLDMFDAFLFGLPVQFCYIQLVLENHSFCGSILR